MCPQGSLSPSHPGPSGSPEGWHPLPKGQSTAHSPVLALGCLVSGFPNPGGQWSGPISPREAQFCLKWRCINRKICFPCSIRKTFISSKLVGSHSLGFWGLVKPPWIFHGCIAQPFVIFAAGLWFLFLPSQFYAGVWLELNRKWENCLNSSWNHL